MANENVTTAGTTYKNVEPFWQLQAAKSFVKAKNDWMGFNKIHLSFVKHEGKPNCKQVAAIEGALSVHGASGALALAGIVLSGGAKKLAEQSRAQANGGYAQPFFVAMGGTPAKRSKDGKCVSRTFTLAPGSRSEYVMTMTECEGEENSLGGIMPKRDVPRESIHVPLTAFDLMDFAQSVLTECTAYRAKALMTEETDVVPAAQPVQAAPAPATAPATSAPTGLLCVIYDTAKMINGGVPVITTVENAISIVQTAIRQLLASPARLVANTETYNNAAALCASGNPGTAVISFTGKENAAYKNSVVLVLDNLKTAI